MQAGDTFFWIKARKKVAVDPRFLFTTADKLRWFRWNPYNLFNEYYPIPSDEFFRQHAGKLERRGLDVVFVDGLHTYEQSLRDVDNSLRYLRDNGLIVVDDCNPPNEPASRPIKPAGDDPWCGDVWKAIAHLRSTRSDLRVCTLDCAFGLGIITKKAAESMLKYSREEIQAMSYADLASKRDALLNVRTRDSLEKLLRSM